MKRRDVARHLDAAGRGPVPSADPVFAESLETRLRAAHERVRAEAERPRLVTAAAERRRDAHRPWMLSPVPVAAALVLLITISASTFLRAPAPGGVELVAAYDATVQRPDGTTEPARPGLRLQEGAVVLTGPDGHVTVGRTRIGPRQIAVVRGAQLKQVDATAPLPAAPETADSNRPTDKPRPSQEPVLDRPALPGVRPRAERETQRPRPTVSPQPSDGGELPASPQPTVKDSERPREEISPSPDDQPKADSPTGGEPYYGRAAPGGAHAIGLMAKADQRQVQLAWTEFSHPAFAFFVILRAPGPEVPQWPPSGRTELVGRSNAPDQRQYLDRDVPYRPTYRIIAVDRDGRELARSAAVAPSTRSQPSSNTSTPDPTPTGSETPATAVDGQTGLTQPALPPAER